MHDRVERRVYSCWKKLKIVLLSNLLYNIPNALASGLDEHLLILRKMHKQTPTKSLLVIKSTHLIFPPTIVPSLRPTTSERKEVHFFKMPLNKPCVIPRPQVLHFMRTCYQWNGIQIGNQTIWIFMDQIDFNHGHALFKSLKVCLRKGDYLKMKPSDHFRA